MKRGSALLVVLGMIAFMVISAVAFSAYMRHSRLPSSYLRRASSSRLLVKAALAEAIELIDISIGDNPHPGVGTRAFNYPRENTMNEVSLSRQRNYWQHRVFIGTNSLISANETVSTLTLEGLAYLPPAIINEVRYYSRRSAAATWRNLGFDAGRYAFTAVDVSDYFDINSAVANVGRNSSDYGKISYAYLFENDDRTDYETIRPSEWDLFMEDYIDAQDPTKIPFTSMADFYLAVNKNKTAWNQYLNPFCRFLNSNGSTDFVISPTTDKFMRLMTFVTDRSQSFPMSDVIDPSQNDNSEEALDLNDENMQPFKMSELAQICNSAQNVIGYSSKAVTKLYESICGFGLCALWDYLDYDNVPLSLAIPTTERVPMVCAIEPKLMQGQLKVVAQTGEVTPVDGQYPQNPQDGQQIVVERVDTYKIDSQSFSGIFMGGRVKTVVAFPFRRNENLANENFKIDGRLSVFLGSSTTTLHTYNQDDVLHLTESEARRGQTIQPTRQPENGVMHAPLAQQQLTFTNVDEPESALREVSFSLDSAAGVIGQWLNNNPLATVTYRWTQTYKVPEGSTVGTWEPASPDNEETALNEAIAAGKLPHCSIPPLNENGTPDEKYVKDNNFANLILNGGGVDLKVFASVWLRVTNESGYIVDLVPACMKDDELLNDINNVSSGFCRLVRHQPQNFYPLMRFSCSDAFAFSFNNIKGGGTLATGLNIVPTPSAVMVGDPRYNHAPEHWFVMPGGAVSKQAWLSNCGVGTAGRDRDIFMATSDAGYLQSVYELAFLPRLTDFQSYGAIQAIGDYDMPENTTLTDYKTSFDQVPNSAFMWRTYRPFAMEGADADDFEGAGFTSRGSGQRVHPFSKELSVTMAALANTPNSWMVASTNENATCGVQKSERKAENFNKEYCFNMMGPSDSKFQAEDLEEIALNLQDAMIRDDGDWERGFRELAWRGKDGGDYLEELCGWQLSGSTCKLYDVDRKFLYGYWHDSFALKQQLFLVFVRAEPTMMGGGAIGQTPPQLGARAVALVWRDPYRKGPNPGDPHQTKILFYRQFD